MNSKLFKPSLNKSRVMFFAVALVIGGISAQAADLLNSPGGGRIFYVAPAGTTFACGPTGTQTCKYLEVAPYTWNGGTGNPAYPNDPARSWAQSTPVNYTATLVGTFDEIGFGYRNTLAIIAQGNSNPATSSSALTRTYSTTVAGVVFDDWFLPSKDELNKLFLNKVAGDGLWLGNYSSSSESNSNAPKTNAIHQVFDTGFQDLAPKALSDRVRPIRAF